LLTEPYKTVDNYVAFYLDNFDVGAHIAIQGLAYIFSLTEHANLVAEEVISLLSVGDHTPWRSANVNYPDQTLLPESGRSGSVYINNNAHPAI
ncbi:hypothetical protein ACQJ0H_22680, partial [Pantoea agglomerans]